MLVYLDSSAIVKRYVEEIGSEIVDKLYEVLEAEQQHHQIVFSGWNFGRGIWWAVRFSRQEIGGARKLRMSMQLALKEITLVFKKC